MAEFQVADAALRRFNAAVMIMVCGAVVGAAYWSNGPIAAGRSNNTPSPRRGPALRGRGPPTGTGARW
jgi:hypothetical protein